MDDGKPQTEHFSDLDGMRGALACAVMVMHYGLDRITAIVTHGVLPRSEWGLSVDFFFLLSGFVMARSFLKRRETAGGYFVKRFFRLAPMYLLALLFAVLAQGPQPAGLTAVNVLMVQSLFDLQSLNYPSWSIPFEMFLPALALPVIAAWSGLGRRQKSALVVLFAMLGSVFALLLVSGLDIRHGRAVAGLATGMAFYLATRDRLSRREGKGIALPVLFAIACVIMIVTVRLPLASLGFYPVALAALTVGATSHSLFSSAPLQALGRWSYSIYLLHIPVLLWSQVILGEGAVGHNPALKLALAAITVALAALAYHAIELPCIRLGSRVGRARARALAS